MSNFYDEMAGTAQDLLGEFGQLATLTRAAVTYNPTTSGVDPGVSPVSVTGVGVALDYRTGEIDGTLVRAGDVRLYLSARGQGGVEMPTPQPGDTVFLAGMNNGAGSTWRVVRAAPLSPAGQNVLHDVQLRG